MFETLWFWSTIHRVGKDYNTQIVVSLLMGGCQSLFQLKEEYDKTVHYQRYYSLLQQN
jgi:hypothetical protein